MKSRNARALRAPARLLIIVACAFGATPLSDAAAQSIEGEVRVGLTGSSSLVVDEVLSPRRASLLFADRDRVAAVRVGARPAPTLGLAVRRSFGSGWSAGVDAGWAATDLEVRERGGGRLIQDLWVTHAAVTAGRRWRSLYELNVGAGLIRYRAEDRGLFAGGAEIEPLIQAAVGVRSRRIGLRPGVGVRVQAHPFRTEPLSRVGGRIGAVWRVAVYASLGWPGGGT